MDTAAFRAALGRLLDLAREAPSAILCAEAVPWRCHRQLIADALVVRGVDVRHVLDAGSAARHVLNPAARIVDGERLVYAGGPTLFAP